MFTCSQSRLTLNQKEKGIECKNFDEINEWRKDKQFRTLVIEPVPNFHKLSIQPLEYNEKWFKGISLKQNELTDAGFRFRHNTYIRTNYYNIW